MLALVAVLGAAAPATASAPADAAGASARTHGYLPPHNPPKNVPPKPDYTFPQGSVYRVGAPLPPCWKWHGTTFVTQPTAKKCLGDEIAALDGAHKAEKIGRLVLPKNFKKLTTAEQLFVLVDIERVARGEPPVVGLSHTADKWAQAGAKADEDPSPGGKLKGATGASGSNWAAAINTLDADYSWMYLDGWAGKHTENLACTGPKASGCWGHRDNILMNGHVLPCYYSTCSYVMGAGYVKDGWQDYSSFTELFIQVAGAMPTLYYTWADAEKEGAR